MPNGVPFRWYDHVGVRQGAEGAQPPRFLSPLPPALAGEGGQGE